MLFLCRVPTQTLNYSALFYIIIASMSSFSAKGIINFKYTEKTQHKTADGKHFSRDQSDHAHLYQFCDDAAWADRNPIPTPSGVSKVELASIPGYTSDLCERVLSAQPDVQQAALDVTKVITDRFLDQTLAISTLDEFCVLTWLVKRNKKQKAASDIWVTRGLSPYATHGIVCPFFGEQSKTSPECICWPAVVNRDRWKYLYSLADRCMLVIDNRFIEMLSTDTECVFIKPHVMHALKMCNDHWRLVFPDNRTDFTTEPDPLEVFLEKCFNLVLRWARCFGLFERYPEKKLFLNSHFMIHYNWISQTQYLSVVEKFEAHRNGGATHGQISRFNDTKVFLEAYNKAADPSIVPNFAPSGKNRAHEMPSGHVPFGAPGPAYGPACGGPGMYPGAPGPAYGRACGGPGMGFGPHFGAAWQGHPGHVNTAGFAMCGAAGPAMYHPGGFPESSPMMGMGGPPPSPSPKKVFSLEDNAKRREKTIEFLATPDGKKDLQQYRKLEMKRNISCKVCSSNLEQDCEECKSRYLTWDLVTYHNTTISEKSVAQSSLLNPGTKAVVGLTALNQPDDPSPAKQKRGREGSDQERLGAAKKVPASDQAGATKVRQTAVKEKQSQPKQQTGAAPKFGKKYGKKADCLCKRFCQCLNYQQTLLDRHNKYCVKGARTCDCRKKCFCYNGTKCICSYHISTGGKQSEADAMHFFNPPNREDLSDCDLDTLDQEIEEQSVELQRAEHDIWLGEAIERDLQRDADAAALPGVDPASNVSAVAPTSDVSAVASTSNVSAVAPTSDVPAVDSASNVPAVQGSDSQICICKPYCICEDCCKDFNRGDPCRCESNCTCYLPWSQGGKS